VYSTTFLRDLLREAQTTTSRFDVAFSHGDGISPESTPDDRCASGQMLLGRRLYIRASHVVDVVPSHLMGALS
jgi:hypothetical protein